ncbi:MAG: UvrD-helicase domain-containing protein [Bacilli bacterium]|nr:UvrD-helicase domain-containing protein [Bacilli bacterium]
MAITGRDFELEEKRLTEVLKLLDDKLAQMGEDIFEDKDKFMEFRRYTWENMRAMDAQELNQATVESEFEANKIFMKQNYFKKLFRIKDNPYFASVVFEDEDKERYSVYLGLTYLKDDDYGNIIYDWRSPICSLFYDFEVGPCAYAAPGGPVKGNLIRKRQYKIQDRKLLSAFDNSMNIDDDLLQEVLATDSNDKMKNIVNTIQQEQNNVIRNVRDKTLIVSGIAGSGKTSVALHRIAFLLYKINNLTSNDVLIFSPNQIFTEYISNVLPELGEDNTLQTTFNDYLSSNITEFQEVEPFMDFIGKFYSEKVSNPELIRYKQSDGIINDINLYIDDYIRKARVIRDFTENKIYTVYKEDLNDLLHNRYNTLPFFERVDIIAEKLSEANYKGSTKKKPTYKKMIMENSSFVKDYKDIFTGFFSSEFCKIRMNDEELRRFNKSKTIGYDDALLFVYMKGLLEGFPYEKDIRQVVIDEAQDYNYLQYLIISKIFRNSNFTILGDVNQTINPYYKYDSLDILANIFKQSKCISLTKTYRSSPEIIEFTNKILGLNHVCAIRKTESVPLIHRTDNSKILEDINYLRDKYKSVAVITRDNNTATKLYEEMKEVIPISLLNGQSEEFNKELVVLPAYLAKGLEFDSVIVYSDGDSKYLKNEKNLLYVACTRAQHELIVYSASK